MKQWTKGYSPEIQIAYGAQYQKRKHHNQQMDRRSEQTSFQRRHTAGPETHEKMLSTTNYERNANQN